MPLLDACRELEAIIGRSTVQACLFREGCRTADIACPVNAGAALTVEDGDGVTFRKHRAFTRQDRAAMAGDVAVQ
jgi:hypothetical protein